MEFNIAIVIAIICSNRYYDTHYFSHFVDSSPAVDCKWASLNVSVAVVGFVGIIEALGATAPAVSSVGSSH